MFGGLEDVNWPVLCWTAMIEGGLEEREADVEFS